MSRTSKAIDDLRQALALWRFWSRLAWHDIKVRYRGSLLGPFWLTISTGLFVGGLGFLYSQLLNQDPGRYIPFLAFGILLWNFLMGTVLECCTAFIAAAGTIKQVKLPLLGHIAQTIWRNLLVLAHHLVIVVLVVVYFQIPVNRDWWLAGAGFLLMLANITWMGVLLAILCTRFRDMTQIVQSGSQIMFFLSPILWEPSMLKVHLWLADYNPLYAMIEIVRGPLIGRPVPAGLWGLALAFMVAGSALAAAAFARYRARIVYWV